MKESTEPAVIQDDAHTLCITKKIDHQSKEVYLIIILHNEIFPIVSEMMKIS